MKSHSNGRGLFSRVVYSPVHHGLFAAKNVVNAGLGAVGKVVDAGVSGVDAAGKAVTGHANALVSNVFRGVASIGRRRKGGRKATRKASMKSKARKSSRKASRKVRKSRKVSRKH